MISITFTVAGRPATKGSYKPGRGKLRADNPRLAAWSDEVAWEARRAGVRCQRAKVPITVRIAYYLDRPGPAAASFAYPAACIPPDVDKVARAVLDALAGVAFEDDKQVTRLEVSKAWAGQGGERITICVEREA